MGGIYGCQRDVLIFVNNQLCLLFLDGVEEGISMNKGIFLVLLQTLCFSVNVSGICEHFLQLGISIKCKTKHN